MIKLPSLYQQSNILRWTHRFGSPFEFVIFLGFPKIGLLVFRKFGSHFNIQVSRHYEVTNTAFHLQQGCVFPWKIRFCMLRILTGKKHPQIKLQSFQKVWIWRLGWLVNQINFLYKVLKVKQNFRKNKKLRSLWYVHFDSPFCLS